MYRMKTKSNSYSYSKRLLWIVFHSSFYLSFSLSLCPIVCWWLLFYIDFPFLFTPLKRAHFVLYLKIVFFRFCFSSSFICLPLVCSIQTNKTEKENKRMKMRNKRKFILFLFSYLFFFPWIVIVPHFFFWKMERVEGAGDGRQANRQTDVCLTFNLVD